MKLKCSTLVTALIMALSVFLGTLTKSEVKSQLKKRKAKKTETSSVIEKIATDPLKNVEPEIKP